MSLFDLSFFLFTSMIMKSLDLQNVVLQLHEQGLSGRKISDQLVGQVSKAKVNTG